MLLPPSPTTTKQRPKSRRRRKTKSHFLLTYNIRLLACAERRTNKNQFQSLQSPSLSNVREKWQCIAICRAFTVHKESLYTVLYVYGGSNHCLFIFFFFSCNRKL